MEIEAYLAEKAQVVNDSLRRLMPGEGEYPKSLHSAMVYSLFAGGKRIRPVLVLAAAEALGETSEAALNTAAAFECIHTYSLIHDDLPAMDDDDLRRGKPTCHKKFGEAAAILAGDGLLTWAFEITARSDFVNPQVLKRVILELTRGAGTFGMISGQMVDIETEGKEIGFPELEHIHIHKTGALILAAVRCGGIIGGADKDELEALTKYGESVGLAFQIADDILDVEGSEEALGKEVGADAKRGKNTYPSHIGLDESKARARELVERAIGALSPFGERAEPLKGIAEFVVRRSC